MKRVYINNVKGTLPLVSEGHLDALVGVRGSLPHPLFLLVWPPPLKALCPGTRGGSVLAHKLSLFDKLLVIQQGPAHGVPPPPHSLSGSHRRLCRLAPRAPQSS